MAYGAARTTMMRVVAHDMLLYSQILGIINSRYRDRFENDAFIVPPNPDPVRLLEQRSHNAQRSLLGSLQHFSSDETMRTAHENFEILIHSYMREAEQELSYLRLLLAPPEFYESQEE